jgi:uncharacterized repeat protein (TIGR03803 family)
MPCISVASRILWIACGAILPLAGQTSPTEIVLHSFAAYGPKGATPDGPLARDAAGNLYGIAEWGGPSNFGVVFKIDPSGRQTVLYSFTGGNDGGNPSDGVVLDEAGNVYGTAGYGVERCGVVYKVTPQGVESVLHAFDCQADGAYPYGLVRDSQGNFYGATYNGGSYLGGVVYRLDPSGHETVLYAFTGGANGGGPISPVIRDEAGNLYGTTFLGGVSNCGNPAAYCGVIFKVDPSGNETVLYTFPGGTDGYWPRGGLIRDSAGNLYGGDSYGGAAGNGMVYRIDPAGQEKILYSFAGRADGGQPVGSLIRDADGNLYGATNIGGEGDLSAGVVYKLDPAGNETVLHSFTGGADGVFPAAGLIQDAAGNLYGTTSEGGTGNEGTVFKVDKAGNESVLYAFRNTVGGAYPQSGVIRDSSGNVYGTTATGGVAGFGTVFRIDASGETILHSFNGLTDGEDPFGSLLRDAAGNFYGTVAFGGPTENGNVFKLDTEGNYIVIYGFTGAADGGTPYSGVVMDSAGNLYGTTEHGGDPNCNCGVVFKVSSSGRETVLHTFQFVDGESPATSLTLDPEGNLYGTTQNGGQNNDGVVYEISAAGQFTVLYNFLERDGGGQPTAGVIRDAAGNLYGTTLYGGKKDCNCGVIYRLDPAGNENELYAFSGGADGSYPSSGLTADAAGNLYGSAASGGTGTCDSYFGGCGVIYRLDGAGNYTVMYNLKGGSAGWGPNGNLLLDPHGDLFGTAIQGGDGHGGVVYKLTGVTSTPY